MAKTPVQKKNPQDATRRNVRAAMLRNVALKSTMTREFNSVRQRITALEVQLRQLQRQIGQQA